MKQIIEDYVSYEIAKLLKEKGFDEPTTLMIDSDGKIRDIGYKESNKNLHWTDKTCACFTHQMALKWLRKVHKIHIAVNVGCDVDNENYVFYSSMIVKLNNKSVEYIESFDEDDEFDSNEKAVEAALDYVLKNLI